MAAAHARPSMQDDPAALPVLELRQAVFGTLSNGSDVRLLATPDQGVVTEEARATIEAFFYAAWRAVSARRAPYFAFLKLDGDGTWGLCRVSALGRGAAGEVVVVWVCLIDEAQLDSIGWATHRLLNAAFDETASLPRPNTRLPARRVELLRGDPASVSAYQEAFDRLAFRLAPQAAEGRGWRGGVRVLAPEQPGLVALSAEGALFGLWNRLGAWRADKSYCTWAGIEAFGFPRPAEHFDLVLSEGAEPIGERLPRTIVAQVGTDAKGSGLPAVPKYWRVARADFAGVEASVPAPASRPADVAPAASARPAKAAGAESAALQRDFEAEVAALARESFIGRRPALLDGDRAQVFRAMVGGWRSRSRDALERPVLDAAAVAVLGSTVEALADRPEDAARAIDAFVAAALPLMPESHADASRAIGALAVEAGLAPRLAGTTLEVLDDAMEPLALRINAAIERLDSRRGIDWRPLLAHAADWAADGAEAALLLRTLIALAWIAEGAPQIARESRRDAEEALSQLALRYGFRAALAVVGQAASPEARQELWLFLQGRRTAPSTRSWRAQVKARLEQFEALNTGRALLAETGKATL